MFSATPYIGRAAARREADPDGAAIPRHVEHVFPQVPVRQWVVTFPRRPRFFLHRDPVLLASAPQLLAIVARLNPAVSR